MRRAAVLLAIAAAGCAAGGTAVHPAPRHSVRVMSLNQCTDQLVLALLPPSRIASVTWLSRDPRFSVEVAAARRVPINHGGAEEVAATAPDLIVTDTFSNPAGRALLERLGYPMIELADAQSVDDIRNNVRTLAAALDERPRGEALIAAMDRALAPSPPTGLTVAAWDRDGMASGPMLAAVLAAVGLKDVGTSGDVEALLAARPDLLIDREAPVGEADHEARGDASLGDNRARHPLVRRLWPASRRLTIPRATLFCATPAIARAAASLRSQLKARHA